MFRSQGECCRWGGGKGGQVRSPPEPAMHLLWLRPWAMGRCPSGAAQQFQWTRLVLVLPRLCTVSGYRPDTCLCWRFL